MIGALVNDCFITSATDGVCQLLNYFDTTTFECTSCATVIPMCMQCSDSLTCTVCLSGYRPVVSTDATGQQFTTCIFNYCGFDTTAYNGITSDCLTCDNLKHCQ